MSSHFISKSSFPKYFFAQLIVSQSPQNIYGPHTLHVTYPRSIVSCLDDKKTLFATNIFLFICYFKARLLTCYLTIGSRCAAGNDHPVVSSTRLLFDVRLRHSPQRNVYQRCRRLGFIPVVSANRSKIPLHCDD